MDPTILSGIFAACVAVAATLAIERLGGRLGGLLATLPTTIVPASLGFWWTAQETLDFQRALYAVPGGMLINAGFLYCWRILPDKFEHDSVQRLLAKVTATSLCVWAALSLMLLTFIDRGLLPLNLLAFFLLASQIVFGFWSCWRRPPELKGHTKVGPLALLARGALAGVAITFSVWLASLGIPVLAGMASVFPAIFLTTMVSVWIAQGAAVPSRAVGPMILGSTSVSAYALIALWAIPQFGTTVGVCVAWVCAVLITSLPSWIFLNWSAPSPK